MVYFDINGKVAIITGGASGLGFQYAFDLLKKGVRGVTLADINPEEGNKSLEKIENKFGKNKAIFVKTDVTNYEEFEDAFKKTVDTFKNVDILINNAGVCHDAKWQREIDINLNGTINGILLGLEIYIPKYKSESEGLILNTSSITGVSPFVSIPVYGATKFAVHGLTLSWGLPSHYTRTKVRVVGVCPGVTTTPLVENLVNRGLGPIYEELREVEFAALPVQSLGQIGPHVMAIIEKAPSGTMWVVEGGEAPYQYQMPDRFTIPKIHLH